MLRTIDQGFRIQCFHSEVNVNFFSHWFNLNQDCKWSYNSGLFISKSLSQVVIATLWQIKLLGHNYLVYFLITKKASFKIQHTTIYTKQRIQTSTCNPTGFGREQDWPDLILHRMQKHLFKCGIIVKIFSASGRRLHWRLNMLFWTNKGHSMPLDATTKPSSCHFNTCFSKHSFLWNTP